MLGQYEDHILRTIRYRDGGKKVIIGRFYADGEFSMWVQDGNGVAPKLDRSAQRKLMRLLMVRQPLDALGGV